MADRRHIENSFGLYLGAILADQSEIWNRDERSHADIGHVTKIAIFSNSRWRTAAILKIALSPYLSQELSDGRLTKKSKFCKFEMADGRHIENCFFWLYLGSILADQSEIWRRDERSHADIGTVTNVASFLKFKMADCRHFENSCISISQPRIIRFRSNLVGRCTSQFPS